MSSDITNWVKDRLYPELYDNIPEALPEFEFTRKGVKWQSTNKRKLTGEEGDSVGKVHVWEGATGYIKDFTRGSKSIVDYVIERDGVEFIDAAKKLAEIAHIQLPQNPNYDPEEYKAYRDKANLLEDANGYFMYCLENAETKGVSELNGHLKIRGYSPEEIKAMEIGYAPPRARLYEYLSGTRNYSKEFIEQSLPLNKGIGDTHILTIPYRSGGTIKGFKFRTIERGVEPKYLNSTGLDRIGGFYNIRGVRGDKDIIIVEGELDALSATVKGIENVVATGGSSVNAEQVKDAIRRGAKSFTICMDSEPEKAADTVRQVNKIIQVILSEGVSRVYIAELPELEPYVSKGDMAYVDFKVDPDRLIREEGVEVFKETIRTAKPYYQYLLDNILSKFDAIKQEGDLTYRDSNTLIDEVVETASTISDPIQRDQYKQLFKTVPAVKALGITEEAIDIAVERLTSTKSKEEQGKELSKLLKDAKGLQDKGDPEKALEVLEDRVKEVKTITAKGLLPEPKNWERIIEEIGATPPAFKTGYQSLDKFVGFAPAAITLIGGRPSHGKTTFMFNLMLSMSEAYKAHSFYFFTYEEPSKNIYVKLLNRLTASDLNEHYGAGLSRNTNYEFIKQYIAQQRSDIVEIEEGKRKLKVLVDSGRIQIIDRNYSVEQLYALISYLNKKESIGAVFIDYIQRMSTERRTQDKRTEIAHISDQVLQIAKDTGLPIILGAQLNRGAAGSNRPSLENLKEAGNLEEDSNTVLSVYNESREEDENEAGESYEGKREVELEIRALKNREGEVNQKATLSFDKWTGEVKEQEGLSTF